jgi:U3 small nucleolar RNA-associated protein 3
MIRFDSGGNHDEDDDDYGNQVSNQVENVFDLGLSDSDDDDDDDESDMSQRFGDESDASSGEQGQGHSDDDKDTASESQDFDDADDNDDDSINLYDDDNDPSKVDVLNWGKSKKNYHGGDTADLEIGQEVEDAELEEEAGKEVLKARLQGMTEEDFMLDSQFDSVDTKGTNLQESYDIYTHDSSSHDTSYYSTKRKALSSLSNKDKVKLLKKNHPELLPLVTHFREASIRPCAEETLLVSDLLFQNKDNAKSVGATTAGLQYLLTKAMLQTSVALNVCQYLLLKTESISNIIGNNINESDGVYNSNDGIIIDDDEQDMIRNHPVIARLNQLNKLQEKIQTNIEKKCTGLHDQIINLKKASTLMVDESKNDESDEESLDASRNDDDSSNDDSDGDDNISKTSVTENDIVSDSSYSDDEDQLAVQQRVMNEARFSFRPNDDMNDDIVQNKKATRTRRPIPTFNDFGDDDNMVDEKDATGASRSLASTMNSISQRDRTKQKKQGLSAEVDDDAVLMKGLKMMEADLGSDSEEYSGDEKDDDEGLHNNYDAELDEDDDEFYREIKKKSTAKKQFKKQLYTAAPKYPRMDEEIEGERAIGRAIMKNRGLVAHKAKINRNPRVKKREQFRKALIRRKGAVREIRTDEGHKYGGEATGVKTGLSRSRKLGVR